MSAKRPPYGYSSTPEPSGGSRKGLYVIGGVVLLVVIAGIVAMVMTSEGGGSDEEATQEQATVTVTGDALPEYPAGAGLFADPATDPAVGMTPPTLKGQDFQGEAVTIEPGTSPMVVIFAAHWCPHCQKEIPLIQEWIDSGELPDDVQVNLVSTAVKADQNNYPPSAWLSSVGWSGQILLDNPDQSAGQAYGLTGYPYIVFVGADGKVVQRASGELPIEQFATFVDDVAV
jgi:cytochrome c biogenesis protein CcmG/thiol:disulfide interchange protein DsbE